MEKHIRCSLPGISRNSNIDSCSGFSVGPSVHFSWIWYSACSEGTQGLVLPWGKLTPIFWFGPRCTFRASWYSACWEGTPGSPLPLGKLTPILWLGPRCIFRGSWHSARWEGTQGPLLPWRKLTPIFGWAFGAFFVDPGPLPAGTAPKHPLSLGGN